MPWFIQLIGFLALGAAVIISAVVALPVVIAKAAGHDQATCDCWDCQNRRTRAFIKREQKAKKLARHSAKGPSTEVRDPKDYWSTPQLRTAYHVMVKGQVYKVGSIRTMPDGNTKVGLENVLTKVPSR